MSTSAPNSDRRAQSGMHSHAASTEHSRQLEGFQQVMLRWEEIRPYNAVHAIELGGPPLRVARLSQSVSAVLGSVGLTQVAFNRQKTSATFQQEGQVPPVEELELETSSLETLSNIMTGVLDNRYSKTNDCPFRITLACRRSETENFTKQYLIIGYRHAIADGHSIVLLLKAILDHYHNGESTSRLTCDVPGLRQMFCADVGQKTAMRRISKLSVELFQGLRCARPSSADRKSTLESFRIHLDDIETAKLTDAAKRYHSTVQDFLMAAQTEAIAEVFGQAPDRRLSANQRLAVTSMIDLRRYADGALDQAIGQFLGMLAVRPQVRMVSEFSELVSYVKTRNNDVKKRREFFWAINSMQLMARIWDVLPLSVNRDIARKLYPFVCALSNFMLAAPVKKEIEQGVIKNYFRGGNLGVLVPLALLNTTVGERVNFCTTHKTDVYSDAEVDQFVDCITRRINRG